MTPEQTVRAFLEHLSRAESEAALALLDADVEWRNTAMPTFRGERVRQMIGDMERRGVGFEVRWHHVAATGEPDNGTVLTDRTDVLRYSGWETSFRVRGTFTVQDGRITLWDDAFSWLELLGSGVAGLGKMLTSR
ncbi:MULTISPECIES: limonene-1,2-epoxide hydrolase family protein [unclassified Nocardioides]|uniref:limonene-1,2-epoxide hydrolase family protein n=1 Tax=unclassified Nocardioides TaxID=2615069 RepID=UPI0000570E95|nr:MULTISPECIES: limonene-1,2-epoxide hydrolase family protein [unclassified Nocardioides]ABL79934.1 Limonene-1,2-epoxide hydrolase [Nocardioides sp. JS614]